MGVPVTPSRKRGIAPESPQLNLFQHAEEGVPPPSKRNPQHALSARCPNSAAQQRVDTDLPREAGRKPEMATSADQPDMASVCQKEQLKCEHRLRGSRVGAVFACACFALFGITLIGMSAIGWRDADFVYLGVFLLMTGLLTYQGFCWAWHSQDRALYISLLEKNGDIEIPEAYSRLATGTQTPRGPEAPMYRLVMSLIEALGERKKRGADPSRSNDEEAK